MSSRGIIGISTGPLIIRTALDGSANNSYILGQYDYSVSSNLVLTTSTNGLLVPTNNINISTISTSSLFVSSITTSTLNVTAVANISTLNVSTINAVNEVVSSLTASTIIAQTNFLVSSAQDVIINSIQTTFNGNIAIATNSTIANPINFFQLGNIADTNELGYISFYGSTTVGGVSRAAYIIAKQAGASSTDISGNIEIYTSQPGNSDNLRMTISSTGEVITTSSFISLAGIRGDNLITDSVNIIDGADYGSIQISSNNTGNNENAIFIYDFGSSIKNGWLIGNSNSIGGSNSNSVFGIGRVFSNSLTPAAGGIYLSSVNTSVSQLSTYVGINKIPSYPLDVNGSVQISATLSTLNIRDKVGSTGGFGQLLSAGAGAEIEWITKSFIIDHPLNSSQWLVHACLEGPEVGVYYRGKSRIEPNNNSTVIVLPDYVDVFASDFTVQLTPIINGNNAGGHFHKLHGASEVVNGQFTVYGEPGEFSWHVYGKRHNINVEPYKSSVVVEGNGPYKWISGTVVDEVSLNNLH
jgi:hypothetical protein